MEGRTIKKLLITNKATEVEPLSKKDILYLLECYNLNTIGYPNPLYKLKLVAFEEKENTICEVYISSMYQEGMSVVITEVSNPDHSEFVYKFPLKRYLETWFIYEN